MSDEEAPIDSLALALFGVRDHIRHHWGCADKRGIGGHHFDATNECALANIIKRYGDERVREVVKVRVARCNNLIEQPDLTATPCTGLLRFAPDDIEAPCDTCGGRCGHLVADYVE